ncbi:hypothetical protein K523DRAFT_163254 [Schizophyllum commune Tattone D]|nr:hypothetical protein K523DRAFT_163254 [Schizophyllum commune Tattone D]
MGLAGRPASLLLSHLTASDSGSISLTRHVPPSVTSGQPARPGLALAPHRRCPGFPFAPRRSWTSLPARFHPSPIVPFPPFLIRPPAPVHPMHVRLLSLRIRPIYNTTVMTSGNSDVISLLSCLLPVPVTRVPSLPSLFFLHSCTCNEHPSLSAPPLPALSATAARNDLCASEAWILGAPRDRAPRFRPSGLGATYYDDLAAVISDTRYPSFSISYFWYYPA